MPLEPQIAEDVLALLERRDDLTKTQVVVLKIAAALLWQDEAVDSMWSLRDEQIDSRLQISQDDWGLIPDRFEILNGVICPKEWGTPNRLKRSDLWNTEYERLRESGTEFEAAAKLASQFVKEKLLAEQQK